MVIHAVNGKTFIPKEIWEKEKEGSLDNGIEILAVVVGFPLYCVGYLIGLPFAEPDTSPESP